MYSPICTFTVVWLLPILTYTQIEHAKTSTCLFNAGFCQPSLLNCVPCVLKTCSRANVPYVLTCQRALRAYMVTCQRALRTYVVTCLRPSRAYMVKCLACLRANVSCVLTCSRALSAYVLVYKRTILNNVNLYIIQIC